MKTDIRRVRRAVPAYAALAAALPAALAGALAGALPFASVPAHAQAVQDAPPDIDNAFSGDYITVAVGGIYQSDYEGSDDYQIGPAAGFRARVSGIGIATRGIGLVADFIPNASGQKVAYSLGPVVTYRANRSNDIDDPVVEALGELDATVEAGVNLGVQFRGVLTPVDSFSIGTDVRWDVSGNGGGRLISPGIGYFTVLSRGAGAGITLGADHVSGKYADYNYSVSPAGSAATGGALPVYDARGGWKNIGARVMGGFDFDGDIGNGGLAAGGMISYERLLNSAAETPITALRGDRDQWRFALGLGYTF